MHLRRLYIAIGCICVIHFCIPAIVDGQSATEDSIQILLAQLPDDSTRIAMCIEEARGSGADVAAVYIDIGLQLARATNDKAAIAKLISEQAIQVNIQGKHLDGAILFLKADSIYRVLNDSMLIAGAQTNIGLSYYHAGQFDQALAHYFEAYRIYDNLPPSTGFSRLLNNLAMCYKYTDKPDEAKVYYLKSISIKKQLADSVGYANTHHNLALLLSSMDSVHVAIASFDTAIAIYQALGMTDDEASSNVALGKVLMDNRQYERASDYLRSGYQYFQKTDPESREFLLVAGDLAALAVKQERWETADRYIDEALVLTTEADRMSERGRLLELKAQISYKLGDGHEAYKVLKEAFALKDSMHSSQRISLIEEMQTKFSVREKEKDLHIAQLELAGEKRMSSLYKSGLITAALIAIIIAALGVFLYRSRKEIQQKQEAIELALHEKELLLKEIHHRVKNNLQIISSLLGMQSYQSRDPNVSDAMRDGQNRVRSMALIHQSLYQDASVIAVDAPEYIHGLVESLKQASRVDPDRISIDTEIEGVRVDVDMMIPLGLILNELLTNALKYAFPDDRKGSIRIVLQQDGQTLNLAVKDNGIGLEPGRLEQSQSMGYTLIRDFCAKLKAELKIDGQQGTEVQIRIPNASARV